MGDFPLVIFTVLSQLAVGAMITLLLLDYLTDRIDNSAGKRLTLMILSITGVGLGFSLLHLGHPLEAYRALTNLGSSWLSREVVLFSVFGALLIAYYFQWRENSRKEIIGTAAAAAGLLAVVSSGMVYVLPAVPAWNNLSPVLFFLLTTAILGPLFVITVLGWKGTTSSPDLTGLTGIILAIYLLSFVLYISVLLSSGGASGQTAAVLLGSSTFWLRAVLTWILPLGLIIWVMRKRTNDFHYVAAAFLLVFAGEILGRFLFYDTAVILKIAGF